MIRLTMMGVHTQRTLTIRREGLFFTFELDTGERTRVSLDTFADMLSVFVKQR